MFKASEVVVLNKEGNVTFVIKIKGYTNARTLIPERIEFFRSENPAGAISLDGEEFVDFTHALQAILEGEL